MAQLAMVHSVTMQDHECGECGVLYAITVSFEQRRRDDHQTFYCPNGHAMHFPKESEAEKNARLLREEQARHKETLSRLNESHAAEENLARKLRRVAKGVCPECKRTFSNLARHMQCKHKSLTPAPERKA